jgi:hypothetical protein
MSHHTAEYKSYTDKIQDILNDDKLIYQFKSIPEYQRVLEHISKEDGEKYLFWIKEKTKIPLMSVQSYCTLNDSIGNPTIYSYDKIISSPTSLRYVLHAHLILTHIKELQKRGWKEKIRIAEVGCGYGGLCMSLYFFASQYDVTIDSYYLIDLKEVIELQRKYHDMYPHFDTSRIQYLDASHFGKEIKERNLFMISNYCFSEISVENRDKYKELLIPKVEHGFMVWNSKTPCVIPFHIDLEQEYPLTGIYNYYIYF